MFLSFLLGLLLHFTGAAGAGVHNLSEGGALPGAVMTNAEGGVLPG